MREMRAQTIFKVLKCAYTRSPWILGIDVTLSTQPIRSEYIYSYPIDEWVAIDFNECRKFP